MLSTEERHPPTGEPSPRMRPSAVVFPVLLFGLAAAIAAFLALVVAPSAGAAGGCGGG
jgi:hypothetical protein